MRYAGKLGLTVKTELAPGYWEDVITERPVMGEVKQTTERLEGDDRILPRTVTSTSLSVPALGLGEVDNDIVRYVWWKGKRWQAESVVEDFPNIVIFIGGLYNGPLPG